MIVQNEHRDCNWGAEYDNSELIPEIHRDPEDEFYAYMAQDAKNVGLTKTPITA